MTITQFLLLIAAILWTQIVLGGLAVYWAVRLALKTKVDQ